MIDSPTLKLCSGSETISCKHANYRRHRAAPPLGARCPRRAGAGDLTTGWAGVCCERRGGLRKMLKDRSKTGPMGAHRDLMSDRGHGQTGGATALTRASSCTRMTSLGHRPHPLSELDVRAAPEHAAQVNPRCGPCPRETPTTVLPSSSCPPPVVLLRRFSPRYRRRSFAHTLVHIVPVHIHIVSCADLRLPSAFWGCCIWHIPAHRV